jgi:hypothetical protein
MPVQKISMSGTGTQTRCEENSHYYQILLKENDVVAVTSSQADLACEHSDHMDG